MALQHLLLPVDPRHTRIFRYSRDALVQLSNFDRVTFFFRQIADVCLATEDAGWSLMLQYISSYSGRRRGGCSCFCCTHRPCAWNFSRNFHWSKEHHSSTTTSKDLDRRVAAGSLLPPLPPAKISHGARTVLRRLQARRQKKVQPR